MLASQASAARHRRSLLDLPNEIISHIISFVEAAGLKQLCLVSRTTRSYAVIKLWRSVDLVDCQTSHEISEEDYTRWSELCRHERSDSVFGVDMFVSQEGFQIWHADLNI